MRRWAVELVKTRGGVGELMAAARTPAVIGVITSSARLSLLIDLQCANPMPEGRGMRTTHFGHTPAGSRHQDA
jgi:hypothetical protein